MVLSEMLFLYLDQLSKILSLVQIASTSPRSYFSFLLLWGGVLGPAPWETDGDLSARCLSGSAWGLAPLLKVVLIPQGALELGWPRGWGWNLGWGGSLLPKQWVGKSWAVSHPQPTLLAGARASASEQRFGQDPSILCNSVSVQSLHPDLFRLWRPFGTNHVGNIRSLFN